MSPARLLMWKENKTKHLVKAGVGNVCHGEGQTTVAIFSVNAQKKNVLSKEFGEILFYFF